MLYCCVYATDTDTQRSSKSGWKWSECAHGLWLLLLLLFSFNRLCERACTTMNDNKWNNWKNVRIPAYTGHTASYAEINFVADNCSFLFRPFAIDLIAHTNTWCALVIVISALISPFAFWGCSCYCQLSACVFAASYQFYLSFHFSHMHTDTRTPMVITHLRQAPEQNT